MLFSLLRSARSALKTLTARRKADKLQLVSFEPIERLVLCEPRLDGTIADVLHGYLPHERISGVAITATLGLCPDIFKVPYPVNASVKVGPTTFADSSCSSPPWMLNLYAPQAPSCTLLDAFSACDSDDTLSSESNPTSSLEPPPFVYAGFVPSLCDPSGIEETLHTALPLRSTSHPSILPSDFSSALGLYYQPPLSTVSLVPTEDDVGSRYSSHGALGCNPASTAPLEEVARKVQPCIISNGALEFEIVGTLGSGGFGHVMLARTQLGEGAGRMDVAIKVMNKDRVYQQENGRDLVVVEGQVLQRITCSNKGYLSKMICSWDDEENIYFVMPLYRGDLCTVMHQRELRHSPATVKRMAAELAFALSNLHDLGIIHRDIKPANILITSDGHLALADFGLSYLSDVDLTQVLLAESSGGTEVYEAPELVALAHGARAVYGSGVDVWALGVVLYEVVMNLHVPYFDARSAKERQMRILQARFDFEAVDEYDMELGDLLFHMLRPFPEMRCTAEEVLRHPYFADIDFESIKAGFHRGPIDPPCLTYKPTSGLIFDVRRDDDGLSYSARDVDKRGRRAVRDVVRDQRKMDEMCPRTHVFQCPNECLFAALYGFVPPPVDGPSGFWDSEEDEEGEDETGLALEDATALHLSFDPISGQ